MAATFFVIAVVLSSVLIPSINLTGHDLQMLLTSDSVTVIPVLLAYHSYLIRDPNLNQGEKAQEIRIRILQLLRLESEPPYLELTPQRLDHLIQMLGYVEKQSDRQLLLKVIAKIGKPACFSALDKVISKICAWELRKDERAQYTLRSMANACKVAIRAGDNKMQVAESLLRASDSTHGLLTPVSPPYPGPEIDNLLHAALAPEDSLQRTDV